MARFRGEQHPCVTEKDCRITECANDHVVAACVPMGPPVPGAIGGVKSFCATAWMKPPSPSCNPPYTIEPDGRKRYKRECIDGEREPSKPEPSAPPSGGSASACRRARADHMGVACRDDKQCASPSLAKECPGVPMKVACEKGKCRSRRTDGCEAPFEVDAEGMRKMIVDCAN